MLGDAYYAVTTNLWEPQMTFRTFLGSFIYQLLPPSSLASMGSRSRIAFPRRIRGNKHITIGDRTIIDSGSWIEALQSYRSQRFSPKIKFGNDVQVGRYATITAIEEIEIGDGCLLSEYVYISDHSHNVYTKNDAPLVKMPLIRKGPVRIGNQCFIGFRSIVMPGVTLGDRCVVGAGAVVTRSFPSNSVIAGVPAKLIRMNE